MLHNHMCTGRAANMAGREEGILNHILGFSGTAPAAASASSASAAAAAAKAPSKDGEHEQGAAGQGSGGGGREGDAALAPLLKAKLKRKVRACIGAFVIWSCGVRRYIYINGPFRAFDSGSPHLCININKTNHPNLNQIINKLDEFNTDGIVVGGLGLLQLDGSACAAARSHNISIGGKVCGV